MAHKGRQDRSIMMQRDTKGGAAPMRHFSDLTQEEITAMSAHMERAAVGYAQEIGMSGLSHNGVHNIYAATQKMLFAEWERSKRNISFSDRGRLRRYKGKGV